MGTDGSMKFARQNTVMPPRRCIREMAVVAMLAFPIGGASVLCVDWATSDDMAIDDAMALAGNLLTPEQEALVISAIRRQTEANIRALRGRGPAATKALSRIHDLSR